MKNRLKSLNCPALNRGSEKASEPWGLQGLVIVLRLRTLVTEISGGKVKASKSFVISWPYMEEAWTGD